MIKTDLVFLSQQLLWPMRSILKPFSFEINVHIKRFRTSPGFKTEARINSKMAY